MDKGVMFLVAAVIASSTSQILLKNVTLSSNRIKKYTLFIVAYLLLLISFILTSTSLKYLQIFIVPIFETSGFLLVSFYSIVFFREKLSKQFIIGTFYILFGIILLSYK